VHIHWPRSTRILTDAKSSCPGCPTAAPCPLDLWPRPCRPEDGSLCNPSAQDNLRKIFTRKRKLKRNARKERVIGLINAPILGAAKRVLNEFQEKGGYIFQGRRAKCDLLLDYEMLQERVKKLEAELAKTREN